MNTGILTFRQKMTMIGRFSVPYGLFFIFFIVNLSVFKIFGNVDVRAPFVLIGIFHWALFRPKLVPHYFAFMIGLALDIFSGLPLGLNALLFVVVQWFVKSQRHVLTGQSFLALWFGFSLIFAPVLLVEWAIMNLFFDGQFEWMIPVLNYGFGLCVFPLVLLILNLVQKILPHHGFDLGFHE